MMSFYSLLLLSISICLEFMFIDCNVDSIQLKVRRVDESLKKKLRQETLDMCRMYNQQHQPGSFRNKLSGHSENKMFKYSANKRIKRDTANDIDDDVNEEDARRVESIVNRLYDDISGEVKYRRRDFNKRKTDNNLNDTRRFNFHPHALLPPEPQKPSSVVSTQDGYWIRPWIKHWNQGVLPYFIDPRTYDDSLSQIITTAFSYFEKSTCIRLQRLRELPTDTKSLTGVEWLYISNPHGVRQCVHSNEQKPNKGMQTIVFGYDCMSRGEIVHEIMHVLGFSHEHTRPDRDKYITIMWENIKPGYMKFFVKREKDPLFNVPYDYASVMHYPPRAFSRNGQLTIIPSSGVKVGQRDGLSEFDVEKVAHIYGYECMQRNEQYLSETCPSAMRSNNEKETQEVDPQDIEKYFEDKIWPFGIINFKIKDKAEFTSNELAYITKVMEHIEGETCIEFRDLDNQEEDSDSDSPKRSEFQKEEHTETKDHTEAEKEVEKSEGTKGQTAAEKEIEQTEAISLGAEQENLANVSLIAKTVGLESEQATTGQTPATQSSAQKRRRKRFKRDAALSPSRRHAANIITIARSADKGCKCPKPGRPEGNKVLLINNDCFNSINDLLHVFVHVLGLDHQHNAHDRDSYLQIAWKTLTTDVSDDLQNKLPPEASVGYPYDYQSIMHFPWLHIKDGKSNLIYPVWNDGWAMGNWEGLSATDVVKINHLYHKECANRKKQTQ